MLDIGFTTGSGGSTLHISEFVKSAWHCQADQTCTETVALRVMVTSLSIAATCYKWQLDMSHFYNSVSVRVLPEVPGLSQTSPTIICHKFPLHWGQTRQCFVSPSRGSDSVLWLTAGLYAASFIGCTNALRQAFVSLILTPSLNWVSERSWEIKWPAW